MGSEMCIRDRGNPVCESGIFEILDVTDKNRFFEIAKKYDVDLSLIHI
ncbi:hypothetical protein CDFC105_31384 [Clostridioides difficile]|nr:hypothetical protein CDFC105_31384 [Clostridioides difficile]